MASSFSREWELISKRWGPRITASVGGDPPTAFTVRLDVHDDGAGFQLPYVAVCVLVPDDYPTVAASISVDAQQGLPTPIAHAMTLCVASQFQSKHKAGSPMIRTALRWLENYAGELLASIAQLQAEAVALHAPAVAATTVEEQLPPPPPHLGGGSSGDPHAAFSWRGLFSMEWSCSEQERFDAALRRYEAGAPADLGSRLRDASTWQSVASLVASKSAEQCLARFLLLSQAAQRWHEAARAPLAAEHDAALREVTHAAAAATAAAAAAAAADSQPPEEEDEEGSSGNDDDGEEEEEDEEEAAAWRRMHEELEAGGAAAEGPAGALLQPAEPEAEAEEYLPAFQGLYLRASHSGTEVLLDGLSAYNIGAMAVNRLCVSVQCSRCATPVSATMRGVTLPGAAGAGSGAGPQVLTVGMLPASVLPDPERDAACEFKGWCQKCSLLLSCYFRPVLMFEGEGGNSLGYVDTTHCEVTSLTDASLYCTCLDCGSVAELPRVAPPTTQEQSCRTCFMRLRFAAKASHVELATLSTMPGPSGVPLRRPKLQKFIPGKPLPGDGACKHYKSSFRWLRFPCCNIAYPCDICHDEKSDHEGVWATRMICGKCAREQPWSNNPCVACGGRMGRGTGPPPRFWEGGAGQRNKAMLSRKDPHRYAGNNKTQSKKTERVGAKGKERTAAASAARTQAGGAGAGGATA